MIHSAVIGLGVIGKVHISAINSLEDARLIAVCDITVCDTDPVVRGIMAWNRSKEYYEAGPWRGIMVYFSSEVTNESEAI